MKFGKTLRLAAIPQWQVRDAVAVGAFLFLVTLRVQDHYLDYKLLKRLISNAYLLQRCRIRHDSLFCAEGLLSDDSLTASQKDEQFINMLQKQFNQVPIVGSTSLQRTL